MQLNYGAKIAILGGGSWGTALAALVRRAVGRAYLYSHHQNIIEEINQKNTNSRYLPAIKLPDRIYATNQLENLLDSEIIIIAVPSIAFAQMMQEMLDAGLDQKVILLVATKGMCNQPARLFSEYLETICPNQYGFITGPNLASEVAKDQLTSIVITAKEQNIAEFIANLLATKQLKTSSSTDIVTVQIASLVKNIVAIGAGMMRAEGAGENALAWLISAASKEIAIISKKLGGQVDSLFSPAVIGDLVLTSYSTKSRNYQFGYQFCKNNYAKNYLTNYPQLVEGVNASRLLAEYLEKYDLAIPVISSIMHKLA